ncbi:MAG TPA: thioredoxin domain-containing protein [Acidobacteriaceae bacterium]|nr:thioredoxin domain-containing protein [Acidobacteriaceae bacterium]
MHELTQSSTTTATSQVSTAKETHNSLAHAASSYLRSAMHQPVDWREWGEAAFAKAREENKPVLLDIGAVWCHWCHVMDRESYEDAEIAEIINTHFIAVKVDRDERLDVDARYQAAVSAMSGQGGWPLTVILTPEGKPFFGGTYFPKDERYGRPGFGHVLLTIAHAYHERKDEVLESADSVMAAIEYNESFSGRSADLHAGIVDKLVASALQQFDKHYGGFGTQPKFPHPAVLDLLLDHAARTGDEAPQHAARMTLDRMAAGGMYDHLAGGFHRYSVDERWVVPHFEKMLYDNSELLKAYVHSFQSFVDPDHARVAQEVILWMDTILSDRERGGFYASQDADESLDDDGDYFTWTREEAAAVLTSQELAVAGTYFDIGEMGDMHHNPQKNTLHIDFSLAEVARRNAVSVEEAEALLDSARQKLYAARLQRPTPYIDRTMYVNWNALAVSAYLEAARVLRLKTAKNFALRTLDRILREAWKSDGSLNRVVAYADGKSPAKPVQGMLDDYAALGLACVDAWEATAEMHYYLHAEAIANAMIARFHDATGGGFFDTAQNAFAGEKLGVLAARRKPLQDSPTPAGNSLAASLLLRLAALGGRNDLREKAEDTLEAFAGVAEQYGLFAGAYGLALQRFLLPPVQVCIVGEDAQAEELAAAATARYAVDKTVLRLPRAIIERRDLPPALAETLPHLPELADGRSLAVVCSGTSCQPAVFEPELLVDLLHR